MVTVILVIVAIAGVLIQVVSFSYAKRLTLTRGLSGLLCIILGTLSAICLLRRGTTHSSLAILGGALVWSGLLLVVLIQVTLLDEKSGVLVVARRPANRRLVRTLTVWCVLTANLALIPLRYIGALTGDPTFPVSGVLALGQFNPPTEQRPINIGQCLQIREPAGRNPVVPCSVAHRSEIITAINGSGSQACPGINTLPHEGLELQIAAVGPFDTVIYCVIQSASPTRSWTGRLGLAYTP